MNKNQMGITLNTITNMEELFFGLLNLKLLEFYFHGTLATSTISDDLGVLKIFEKKAS